VVARHLIQISFDPNLSYGNLVMKKLIIFLFLLSVSACAQLELPRIEPGDEIVKHPNYTPKLNDTYKETGLGRVQI